MSEHDLIATVRAWDEAMVGNDGETIGRFMADEWIIIGSDGGVGDKKRFLALVASGALTHDVMTTEEPIVRLYGDAALLIARGVSAGAYQGKPFREVERSSNLFVRRDGRWVCVSTHLSKLAEES